MTEPTTPGIYPVGDLTKLPPTTAARLLLRATQEADLDGVGCPHLVTTWDLETRVITYDGPFTNGLDALTFAHQLLGENEAATPGRRYKLTIEPLLPH